MKRYWFYGYLMGYLSIQGHEALHWLFAVFLGLEGAVGSYSYAVEATVQPWKFIVVAAAGALATITYAIVGVLLFKSRYLFLKRIGFLLVFINAAGRILYEFSSLLVDLAPDETGIAAQLGIPDYFLRVPPTLFCILTLLYILRDQETGLKSLGNLLVLSVVLLLAIGQVLVLGSLVNTQQSLGRGLFQPILLGYTPFLAIVNLAYVVIFYLMARRDYRKSKQAPPNPALT